MSASRTVADDGSDSSAVRKSLVAGGAAAGGTGGAILAAIAGLCCAGPATVALLGAGGAVLAAGLQPYKPLLLLGSLAMILFGFWYAYGPRARMAAAGRACPVRVGRASRTVLWVSALLWVAAAVYQPRT